MASTNGSNRPSGCVSIPVEIIREPTGSSSHSRHNSPFRTIHNDSSTYGGFSNSPPWNTNPNGRFQRRQSPSAAYDRVISNSHFNQPFNDHSSYQQFQEPQYRQPQQRLYEPGPTAFSRSNEDLLSSPFDSMRTSAQPQYSSLIPPTYPSGFRTDSDFVEPNKFSSPLRRSYDALNDFADMQRSFPTTQQQQPPSYRSTYQTQYQPQSQQQQPTYVNQAYINPNIVYTNEYGAPTDHYQPSTFQATRANVSNDRSRSPASQRGASPARPQPSTSQQQDEPELKMAKDTDGPIPMPAPAHSSSPTQSTEQSVPSNDTSASANASPPPPPPPEPVRDPNTIALEKLEQFKQSLDNLEKEVDVFSGSTRNERAYKLLDEQALKIMIRCDELVDVSADIKEKRKEMIRNVQRVINKLESKVPATPAIEQNSNPLETAITSNHESSANHNEENIQMKSSSPLKENTSASTTTTTEQSIST
jgi:hypothetical protein